MPFQTIKRKSVSGLLTYENLEISMYKYGDESR